MNLTSFTLIKRLRAACHKSPPLALCILGPLWHYVNRPTHSCVAFKQLTISSADSIAFSDDSLSLQSASSSILIQPHAALFLSSISKLDVAGSSPGVHNVPARQMRACLDSGMPFPWRWGHMWPQPPKK